MTYQKLQQSISLFLFRRQLQAPAICGLAFVHIPATPAGHDLGGGRGGRDLAGGRDLIQWPRVEREKTLFRKVFFKKKACFSLSWETKVSGSAP